MSRFLFHAIATKWTIPNSGSSTSDVLLVRARDYEERHSTFLLS
ncbi:hypothetical protein [Candidatus Amarobacter glycogenicus]